MLKYTVNFVTYIATLYPTALSKPYFDKLIYKCGYLSHIILYKRYTKRPDSKDPSRQEQVDTVKMPGFVDPQTMHEEGYFTQKAKQQIEELKKRLDKPKAESGEKKE